MTSIQKQKEETTKMCHSMMLSYGQPCSVRSLENDYLSMVGERIPYKKLGYVNLESYLRDCPNHFSVFWDGPQMMVKHVTNESTRHIEQLIKAQKKPKKRSSKRPSIPVYRPRVYPKPKNQPPPAKLLPVVDNISRGKIRTLLYSYNNGLLGSNFDVAYSRRYGGHITFKDMGFNSLYDMFKSMMDIVRIEEMASGGYKLFPRTSMKSTSQSATRPIQSQSSAQTSQHHPQEQSGRQNLPPRLQRKAPDDRNIHQHQHKQQHRPSASVAPRQSSTRSEQTPSQKRNDGYSAIIPEEDLWEEDVFDMSGVNLVLQKEIQQVLAKFPDGVWASEFPAEYRVQYGHELDRRSQGHDSIISLMSVLPHIVTIQRPNQRDWKLFDARMKRHPQRKHSADSENKSTNSGHQDRGSYSTAPPVETDFKETIHQVVCHYPQGVLLGELEDVYCDLTGENLMPSDLGYATIDALISSTALSDTVRLEYKRETGQVLVFPMRRENSPKTDRLKKLHMIKSGPAHGHGPSQRREIPADVVGPSAMYRQQTLPREVLDAKVKYVEVYVSTVTNPSHLWIQLRGPHTTDELERIMDELEYVYTDRAVSEAYTLPQELIAVGQVCAAIYPNDGDWHRCTITAIRDENFVEVYYVDYGSSYVVTKKSLKFLQMTFLKLPAQALKAKLANIKPCKGGEWTKGAKDRLLNLVSNQPLIALITDISQENELSICLTDTTTETDIHINDLLVAEHLAEMVYPEDATEPFIEEEEEASPEVPDETIEESEKQPMRRHTLSQSRSEPYSVGGERNVKFVQLTDDYTVHLIKFEEKPHVTSAEIANLLWPGKDILRSMMRQKKLVLPKVVLPKDDYRDLFEEFEMYQITGTLDADSHLKSHVTVFELSSVGKILEEFDHPSEELKASVQQQIDLFNPQDGYWKGEGDSDDYEDDEDDDDDADDIKYGRQTLETALQSLQFRRRKILQAMQNANLANPVGLVEDLQNVEYQLGDIKKRIQQLEKLEKDGSVKSGDSNKKLSQEEDLVCTVVSEQHDSYVEANLTPKHHTLPVGAMSPRSTAAGAGGLVTSPMAKVSPMQSLNPTAKTSIKTNPVAPMPAEPRTPASVSGPQLKASDLSSAMLGGVVPESTVVSTGGMVMPFSAAGAGDSATAAELMMRQQFLIQYQYNMLAMQNLMQQQQQRSATSSTPAIDPATLLMHQQAALAAQMQFPVPGTGRGAQTFSHQSGATAFGQGFLDDVDTGSVRLLGQGRGRMPKKD